MKKICFLVSAFFCVLYSFAQGFKITEVKETISGSDAFHAPMDRNGHPCGLVKIQSTIQDLRFEGEVDGDISFENNEYKVFLAKGSKQIVIKRPQVMPIVVNFPDYGIGEISSKATYIIKLKEVSLNATKNLLIVDVKPRTAIVYIDELLIDNENGDGGYRLLLPKGEHLCKIECKGYRSYAAVFKSGKETQVINAELESLLADVEINSQTSGARIFIDDEEVGIGSWKGKLPAGTYKVDAQLEGFVSASQSLLLEEKDNRIVRIPQLKRAKGSLSVITDINEANVYLDGKLIPNPKNIKDVQTGEHNLAIKAPFGYKDFERNVIVRAGLKDSIEVKMEPLNETYAKAFAGNIDAWCLLCSQKIESSKYNENDSIERNYWFEKIFNCLDRLKKEQFRKVCPINTDQTGSTDLTQAGIYTYFFFRDSDKAIKILKTWDKFDPGDESVVKGIVQLFYKKNCDEDVIKWAAKAVDLVCYEREDIYYMQLIAEICLKQGNIDKAITLYKRNVHDPERLINRYIAIGNAYKKFGDKKTAITYYEQFLKEAPSANKYEREEVQNLIQECKR